MSSSSSSGHVTSGAQEQEDQRSDGSNPTSRYHQLIGYNDYTLTPQLSSTDQYTSRDPIPPSAPSTLQSPLLHPLNARHIPFFQHPPITDLSSHPGLLKQLTELDVDWQSIREDIEDKEEEVKKWSGHILPRVYKARIPCQTCEKFDKGCYYTSLGSPSSIYNNSITLSPCVRCTLMSRSRQKDKPGSSSEQPGHDCRYKYALGSKMYYGLRPYAKWREEEWSSTMGDPKRHQCLRFDVNQATSSCLTGQKGLGNGGGTGHHERDEGTGDYTPYRFKRRRGNDDSPIDNGDLSERFYTMDQVISYTTTRSTISCAPSTIDNAGLSDTDIWTGLQVDNLPLDGTASKPCYRVSMSTVLPPIIMDQHLKSPFLHPLNARHLPFLDRITAMPPEDDSGLVNRLVRAIDRCILPGLPGYLYKARRRCNKCVQRNSPSCYIFDIGPGYSQRPGYVRLGQCLECSLDGSPCLFDGKQINPVKDSEIALLWVPDMDEVREAIRDDLAQELWISVPPSTSLVNQYNRVETVTTPQQVVSRNGIGHDETRLYRKLRLRLDQPPSIYTDAPIDSSLSMTSARLDADPDDPTVFHLRYRPSNTLIVIADDQVDHGAYERQLLAQHDLDPNSTSFWSPTSALADLVKLDEEEITTWEGLDEFSNKLASTIDMAPWRSESFTQEMMSRALSTISTRHRLREKVLCTMLRGEEPTDFTLLSSSSACLCVTYDTVESAWSGLFGVMVEGRLRGGLYAHSYDAGTRMRGLIQTGLSNAGLGVSKISRMDWTDYSEMPSAADSGPIMLYLLDLFGAECAKMDVFNLDAFYKVSQAIDYKLPFGPDIGPKSRLQAGSRILRRIKATYGAHAALRAEVLKEKKR